MMLELDLSYFFRGIFCFFLDIWLFKRFGSDRLMLILALCLVLYG